jgi:hypothetical protein
MLSFGGGRKYDGKEDDTETTFLLRRKHESTNLKKQCSGSWAICLALFLLVIYFVFRVEENSETSSSKSTSIPHIVMFVADDQGFNDIGYQSSDLSQLTPHIDR